MSLTHFPAHGIMSFSHWHNNIMPCAGKRVNDIMPCARWYFHWIWAIMVNGWVTNCQFHNFFGQNKQTNNPPKKTTTTQQDSHGPYLNIDLQLHTPTQTSGWLVDYPPFPEPHPPPPHIELGNRGRGHACRMMVKRRSERYIRRDCQGSSARDHCKVSSRSWIRA